MARGIEYKGIYADGYFSEGYWPFPVHVLGVTTAIISRPPTSIQTSTLDTLGTLEFLDPATPPGRGGIPDPQTAPEIGDTPF